MAPLRAPRPGRIAVSRACILGAAGAVAASVLVIGALSNLAQRLERRDDPSNGQDFAAYYMAAVLLARGDPDIYQPDVVKEAGSELGVYPDRVWHQPYLYPPLFAQALRPLAGLDFGRARGVWAAGSGALILLMLLITLRAAPKPCRAWIALLWLALPHHAAGLFYGQVDPVITAFLALGAVAFAGGRAGGASLATLVAGAIKLSPLALYAVANCARPRWAKGVALVGCIAPGALVAASWDGSGLGLWVEYVGAISGLTAVTRDWVENVSLAGASRRLLGPEPGDLVHRAVSLVLLAALAVAARHTGQATRQARGWLYSAATVWMLLAAPITWPSGLSLLVIPMVFMVTTLAERGVRARDLIALSPGVILWAPDLAMGPLALGDIAYLRTGALLACFVVLLSIYRPTAREALPVPNR